MFFYSSSEEKLKSNEKKIKELGIQLDLLSTEVERFYRNQQINSQEIEEYFSSPENFSTEEWETLQRMQENHAKHLEAIQNNIKDPRQTKKKYAERVVDPRWLFVR